MTGRNERADAESVVQFPRRARFSRIPYGAPDADLSRKAWDVLGVIGRHPDADGHTKVGRKFVTNKARIHPRHLARYIQELTDASLLREEGDGTFTVLYEEIDRPSPGPNRPSPGPNRPSPGPAYIEEHPNKHPSGQRAHAREDNQIDLDDWRAVVRAWQAEGSRSSAWPRERGLPPTHPATRVPQVVRDEFDIR
jgi:hypothetical protein